MSKISEREQQFMDVIVSSLIQYNGFLKEHKIKDVNDLPFERMLFYDRTSDFVKDENSDLFGVSCGSEPLSFRLNHNLDEKGRKERFDKHLLSLKGIISRDILKPDYIKTNSLEIKEITENGDLITTEERDFSKGLQYFVSLSPVRVFEQDDRDLFTEYVENDFSLSNEEEQKIYVDFIDFKEKIRNNVVIDVIRDNNGILKLSGKGIN